MEQITYCGALLFLAMLSLEDIKERQISAKKVTLSGIIAVICRIFSGHGKIDPEMAVCLIPGLILLVLAMATKEKIGIGDGMTVMVLGLWLGGFQTILVLCIALTLAGFFAAACLIRKKKEPIPFVPFLLLGMEVLIFYA